MKVAHYPCGVDVSGESDDELVTNLEQHIESDHPDMVGSYSREQILSMARSRRTEAVGRRPAGDSGPAAASTVAWRGQRGAWIS